LPAWFVFVLWILFQLIGTLEQRAGMSSVSSAAHLGGAAVGVVAWLLWRKEKSNDEARRNDEVRMRRQTFLREVHLPDSGFFVIRHSSFVI
jgi:membrane associated rhomboid family serine protease